MDLTYNICTLSPDPGAGENCRRLTGSDGKASAYSARDPGLIPGLGRSPGEGHGNPLQYSCLENPMDGGACWATVHGVTKSRTRLSDFAFTYLRAGTGPRRSTNHRVAGYPGVPEFSLYPQASSLSFSAPHTHPMCRPLSWDCMVQ